MASKESAVLQSRGFEPAGNTASDLLYQGLVRIIRNADLASFEVDMAKLHEGMAYFRTLSRSTGMAFALMAMRNFSCLEVDLRPVLDLAAPKAGSTPLVAWMESIVHEDAKALAGIHKACAELLPDLAHTHGEGTRISYNLRYTDRRGRVRRVLQQVTALQNTPQGYPALLMCLFADITHLHEGEPITATIETAKGDLLILRPNPADPEAKPEVERGPFFTGREAQILGMVSEGMSSQDVARALAISANTVAVYRKKMLQRSGCRDLTALATYARLVGWWELGA